MRMRHARRRASRIGVIGLLATSVLAVTAGQSLAVSSESVRAKLPACSSDAMKVTVKKVPQPVNHLLLTATNTSTKPCHAYNGPFLSFARSQAPLPAVADSKPQATVTVQPGASAYAGISTSAADGSGENGYHTQGIVMLFSDAEGEAPTGDLVSASLPDGKNFYVDDSAYVTYWQNTPADALIW